MCTGGITSVNFREQQLVIATVPEKTASQLLHNGEIKISGSFAGESEELLHLATLNNGKPISRVFKRKDKSTLYYKRVETGHRANLSSLREPRTAARRCDSCSQFRTWQVSKEEFQKAKSEAPCATSCKRRYALLSPIFHHDDMQIYLALPPSR